MFQLKYKHKNGKIYIYSKAANSLKVVGYQACQITENLFMEGFLQNELPEGNVMLVKVNWMYNFEKLQPKASKICL